MARVFPINTIVNINVLKEIQMSELRVLEKLDEVLQIVKGKQPSDKWMDINDVVEYTSMSKSSVRRACADGRLKFIDSQGKHLFRRSSVEAWLSNG